MGLLITLIIGLFTLLGSIIVFITSNNKKIVDFSINIAFGVLSALILIELIPETMELINTKINLILTVILMLVLILVGIIVLRILDKFIPDHDTKEEHNLEHVGLMTACALCIHNFLEGITIYTSINNSIRFGTLLGIGVALHNIPLGMSITSFYYKKGKSKALFLSLIVSLITFLGAFVVYLFKNFIINDFLRGIILAITLGMLIYIVIFELLSHIIENKNKKKAIVGIAIGFVILFISTLFE